jgi:hypothetical protein
MTAQEAGRLLPRPPRLLRVLRRSFAGVAPLIAVTDHAVERYRQRGTLDARTEIAARVGRAWAAGAVTTEPPPGAAAQRGSVYVRDGRLVFVCLDDRPRGELVVVTLWEEGEEPAVARRFTEALKRR